MSLIVWGYGMPDLIITWGLGKFATPDIDYEFFEEDIPKEVEVTITPLPDEIQFEEK